MEGTVVADETPTRVFISYSRADAEATERVREALLSAGLHAYLDKHDIAPGEEWRGRLGGLIESADSVVFLISPDSVASKMCDWEVNHAELLGKRIIPVIVRDTLDTEVPERLRRLNYVFMRSLAEVQAGMSQLTTALAVDIAWVRAHTRFGELSEEWQREGKPPRLLLRGAGIQGAERWRDVRSPTSPAFTQVQLNFIATSRRAAISRQRAWIGASVLVSVAAVALSIFALTQQRAAESSRAATAASFASSDFRRATELVNSLDTTPDGVAFLARASRQGDSRATARLWSMLQQRSFWTPLREEESLATPRETPQDVLDRFKSVDLNGNTEMVAHLSLSADGTRVATVAASTQIRVWTRERVAVTDWFQPFYAGETFLVAARCFISPQGRYLVIVGTPNMESQFVEVIDLDAPSGPQVLNHNIRLPGRLPSGIDSGITFVDFYHPKGVTDMIAAPLMLLGSESGQVRVYRFDADEIEPPSDYDDNDDEPDGDKPQGTYLEDIARDYGSEIVSIAFDNQQGASDDWLMSATVNGTVHVFERETYTSFELAAPMRIASRPTSVAREGESGLAIESEDGKTLHYAVRSPLQAVPSPTVFDDRFCLKKGSEGEADSNYIHPAAGDIYMLKGDRQVAINRAGGAVISSHEFPADILTVCGSPAGAFVAITMANWVTEIWNSELSRRVGAPIDEKQTYDDEAWPQTVESVAVTDDGRQALINTQRRAFTTDVENWESIWDTRDGLPLIDRQEVGRVPILVVPPAVARILPEYMEALVGRTIDASGASLATPNAGDTFRALDPLVLASLGSSN